MSGTVQPAITQHFHPTAAPPPTDTQLNDDANGQATQEPTVPSNQPTSPVHAHQQEIIRGRKEKQSRKKHTTQVRGENNSKSARKHTTTHTHLRSRFPLPSTEITVGP